MKTIYIWVAAVMAGADVLTQLYLAGKGVGIANQGISFGLGQSIDIWPVVIVLVMAYLIKNNRRSAGVPFMLFGGLGNLIVRWRLGFVWDYIPLLGLSINGCDLIINFGLFALVIEEWKKQRNKSLS